METIDLKNLTPEQKEALRAQILAEEKANEENRKREVTTYQHLKDLTVEKVFARLQKISGDMQNAKEELLSEFHSLLGMKNELYGVKETQLSHNWSNSDASVTVITGFNTIDRWDESVSAGIERVNVWLDKQMTDGNRNLVNMVRDLLKPNKEGVLKASRVLDLQNQADKIGDPELIDAVKLIREAHRPDKTGTYIKAKYRDADGNSHWLGLSMSSV
jgi:hypothetical protein